MKIAVIGCGYVGLVTAACFADLENEVICVEKNSDKLDILRSGEVPFFEPGLQDLIAKGKKNKRLLFTVDLHQAVQRSQVVFIAVGTPPDKKGKADVSAVIEVAEGIASSLKKTKNGKSFKVIVSKSTVPVGMDDIISKVLKRKGVPDNKFAVVSNPEFLREGSAISDFKNPDRIVIGAENNKAFNLLTELYRPLNAHIIFTTIRNSELIKYVSNAFLATKISFINEMSRICERVGSDVVEVAAAIGLDRRIGREYLDAGLGYGGSCFPKDVSALLHLSKDHGYDPKILDAVMEVNDKQIDFFVRKIVATMKNVKNKQMSVLGLAFKPNTDDLREAPSIKLIKLLQKHGAKIHVYDPAAGKISRKILKNVSFFNDLYDCISGSDAIVIATEWPEFKEIDLDHAKRIMKKHIIFDGRNMFNPRHVREAGFKYMGVGR